MLKCEASDLLIVHPNLVIRQSLSESVRRATQQRKKDNIFRDRLLAYTAGHDLAESAIGRWILDHEEAKPMNDVIMNRVKLQAIPHLS